MHNMLLAFSKKYCFEKPNFTNSHLKNANGDNIMPWGGFERLPFDMLPWNYFEEYSYPSSLGVSQWLSISNQIVWNHPRSQSFVISRENCFLKNCGERELGNDFKGATEQYTRCLKLNPKYHFSSELYSFTESVSLPNCRHCGFPAKSSSLELCNVSWNLQINFEWEVMRKRDRIWMFYKGILRLGLRFGFYRRLDRQTGIFRIVSGYSLVFLKCSLHDLKFREPQFGSLNGMIGFMFMVPKVVVKLSYKSCSSWGPNPSNLRQCGPQPATSSPLPAVWKYLSPFNTGSHTS